MIVKNAIKYKKYSDIVDVCLAAQRYAITFYYISYLVIVLSLGLEN